MRLLKRKRSAAKRACFARRFSSFGQFEPIWFKPIDLPKGPVKTPAHAIPAVEELSPRIKMLRNPSIRFVRLRRSRDLRRELSPASQSCRFAGFRARSLTCRETLRSSGILSISDHEYSLELSCGLVMTPFSMDWNKAASPSPSFGIPQLKRLSWTSADSIPSSRANLNREDYKLSSTVDHKIFQSAELETVT